MRRRLCVAIACLLAVSVPAAAQQSERLMRNVKLGQNGRVSITNVSGDITVTGGPGDEVSIEAVKRTSGDRAELAAVQIEVIERAPPCLDFERFDARVQPQCGGDDATHHGIREGFAHRRHQSHREAA